MNRIPDPPCDGKMLRSADESAELFAYKPTVLEARYRFPLLDDSVDLGLNFDVVDVTSWESPWVRLEAAMPVAKRKKHSDTDSSAQASFTSYYQHYQKKHKADIASNAIVAAKHGRVAAADVVLPFEQQMRSIPKSQQAPLFQREAVAKVTTATSVPSSSAVTWLKRTEYMTAKDERALAVTSAFISESLAQLEEYERKQNGALSLTSSGESHSTNTNAMDVDDDLETSGANSRDSRQRDDTMDEGDRLLEEVMGSQSGAGAKNSASKSKVSSNVRIPASMTESPFKKDASKVLQDIQRSFDVIASRQAIVHPSSDTKTASGALGASGYGLRRSSGVGIGSSSSSSSANAPHIVEEWDIFPNDLVWANSYLLLQSEVALPKGDLSMVATVTHKPTLLKPAHTTSEFAEAHAAHVVAQRRPEVLAVYAKPSLNPGKTVASEGAEDEPDAPKCAADEVAFSAHWEAEATSLLPSFESIGSYVFVLGPTTAYDADEDEESGIVYEGENSAETAAARTRKNASLAKAKVGTATFKNIDTRLHMRPPTAEARSLAEKKERPDVLKLVPVAIPDLELHLRDSRTDTLSQ